MNTMQIIAIVIFAATIITVMTEKVHRAVAAVVGALLLILTGVLTVESGFSYVDINTIGVLIGMMLFVAIVKNSGIFEYIAIKAAKIAKGRPWPLMLLLCIITAVLSGFLDNVTTVLLIGPMTLAITNMLKTSAAALCQRHGAGGAYGDRRLPQRGHDHHSQPPVRGGRDLRHPGEFCQHRPVRGDAAAGDTYFTVRAPAAGGLSVGPGASAVGRWSRWDRRPEALPVGPGAWDCRL